MTIFFFLSLAVFMVLCAVLCLVILVQESKSLGLGASFGGDPGDSLFGTSTADVLKKFTAWLACLFMLCCVLLSLWTSAMSRNKVRYEEPTIEQSP
ncbi:MAG: preprotein translocase subunit SecG [Simkania sp.]|nr:preprotein translocase subunit SecG [Simkania sp.]